MTSTSRRRPRNLGEAEQSVMNYVWSHGPVSAEDCREALRETRPMKESTMRTVLRRLEDKGYVTHTTSGRTYLYSASEPPATVAARAVKHIIDRFCGGSAEALVLGMVDNAVLSPKQLERLTKKIAQQKEQKS
jgi:predicted transcriptional regulator